MQVYTLTILGELINKISGCATKLVSTLASPLVTNSTSDA